MDQLIDHSNDDSSHKHTTSSLDSCNPTCCKHHSLFWENKERHRDEKMFVTLPIHGLKENTFIVDFFPSKITPDHFI